MIFVSLIAKLFDLSWKQKYLCQSIGLNNIRSLNPMQNHIHDADDISQALLFFAIESLSLQVG